MRFVTLFRPSAGARNETQFYSVVWKRLIKFIFSNIADTYYAS